MGECTLDKRKSVTEWREELEAVLDIKKNEFQMLGYDKTTTEDIWNCLRKTVWKDKEPQKRLYEVVAEILQLQITTYMTYLTMGIYQDDEDLMASISALKGD